MTRPCGWCCLPWSKLRRPPHRRIPQCEAPADERQLAVVTRTRTELPALSLAQCRSEVVEMLDDAILTIPGVHDVPYGSSWSDRFNKLAPALLAVGLAEPLASNVRHLNAARTSGAVRANPLAAEAELRRFVPRENVDCSLFGVDRTFFICDSAARSSRSFSARSCGIVSSVNCKPGSASSPGMNTTASGLKPTHCEPSPTTWTPFLCPASWTHSWIRPAVTTPTRRLSSWWSCAARFRSKTMRCGAPHSTPRPGPFLCMKWDASLTSSAGSKTNASYQL